MDARNWQQFQHNFFSSILGFRMTFYHSGFGGSKVTDESSVGTTDFASWTTRQPLEQTESLLKFQNMAETYFWHRLIIQSGRWRACQGISEALLFFSCQMAFSTSCQAGVATRLYQLACCHTTLHTVGNNSIGPCCMGIVLEVHERAVLQLTGSVPAISLSEADGSAYSMSS